MKIIYIFVLIALFAPHLSQADDTNSVKISETAHHYLNAVLDPKLKDATITEKCGTPTLKSDTYNFVCTFKIDSGKDVSSYAVFLGESGMLVGIVRGIAHRAGKSMGFVFNIKSPPAIKEFPAAKQK